MSIFTIIPTLIATLMFSPAECATTVQHSNALVCENPEPTGACPPVEACCYCNGPGWVCEPWDQGPEACQRWGYDEGLTTSWFQDCPEAATPDPYDDLLCPASCA